jgi:hypothetical protein
VPHHAVQFIDHIHLRRVGSFSVVVDVVEPTPGLQPAVNLSD